MNNKFNISIIGAGIVGLSIAERLSRNYKNIILFDKESTFGQHISSRNSEVIHSGFYYPYNSLKSKLCIDGNKEIYNFSDKYNINYKKCGKMIVINDLNDETKLYDIYNNAKKCGLSGLKILNKKEAKEIEERVRCIKALWIPSSGIVDSHGIMSKLENLSILNGVDFAYNYSLKNINFNNNLYELSFNNNELIYSDIVINTTGLWSDNICKMLNLNNYDIEYYKGDYYKSNIKNLNCLIYPLPKKVSLGLHTVLSLNGDVSFGPNYYKVNNVDYSIDNKHESEYLAGFKQLLDDNDLKLTPDFSGIRPKIKNNGSFNDFIIKNEKDQGFNNFINLIGIDSPGLTSSLSIAKYVESLINY
jgi:L-2-hydroxyglutarate oxidase LhgO